MAVWSRCAVTRARVTGITTTLTITTITTVGGPHYLTWTTSKATALGRVYFDTKQQNRGGIILRVAARKHMNKGIEPNRKGSLYADII